MLMVSLEITAVRPRQKNMPAKVMMKGCKSNFVMIYPCKAPNPMPMSRMIRMASPTGTVVNSSR